MTKLADFNAQWKKFIVKGDVSAVLQAQAMAGMNSFYNRDIMKEYFYP